jgi:signal transduction histidine kinase
MYRITMNDRTFSPFKKLLIFSGVFIAYVAVAWLGTWLYRSLETAPALIWPASAVSLVSFVLFGYQVWPLIFAGSIVASLLSGVFSPVILAAVAAGNAAQGAAGLLLLRRRNFSFTQRISRMRDMFSLMLVASVVTMIAPTVGLAAQWATSGFSLPHFWTPWVILWLGEMMAILILAPFFLSWLTEPWVPSNWRRTLEVIATTVPFIALCFLIYWKGITQWSGIPLVYLLLIPLLIMALRLGTKTLSFALLVMTVLGLVGPILGAHRAASAALGQELILIELFVIIISTIFLILAAGSQERLETTKLLTSHVDQLEYALTEVSSLNRAKNEFIAIMAHELRNPLASVVSHLDLIKKTNPDKAEMFEYVKTIDSSVLSMSRILDDLLDMSRISQQKFKLYKEIVVLQDVISLSVTAVTPLLDVAKRTFSVNMPSEPIYVEADRVRLQQILVNLLNNAIKYTEADGHITLTCIKKYDNTILISVKDDGIGIPSDVLERIFEPFVQAAPHHKPRVGSMGIGLFLGKKFAELHGGSIEVFSEGVGKGSEFVVRWPALRDDRIPAPQAVSPDIRQEEAVPVRARRILVVDDNAPVAKALGKLLRHAGHTVQIAHDGPSALTTLKEYIPEIVLLDIGLPGMNGYEVARAIRQQLGFGITLIALTGYGQSEDRLRSQEAGFDHHLTKPVSIKDLEELIARS